MRYVNYFIKGLLFASACLPLGACSDDVFFDLEQDKTQNEETTHTIAMEFIGDVVGFEQQSDGVKVQTRSSSSSWRSGDKIYITFYKDSSVVSGVATYDSLSGWFVNYDGNIEIGSNLKCEARFFVNATYSNSSLVSLNPDTEIYEDLNGIYTYNNGFLTVQASLTPKTGRIRFTGTPGEKIYLTGISVYTTFAPAINQFSTSKEMIKTIVGSKGSTPYIHGIFSDSDRNIGLIDSISAYTRTCSADMLMAGESGYMAIPSESSHNNWRSGLYVKASGVEFKMIHVADYSGSGVFFLIGETEVTEALYKSVYGTSSNSLLPISNISVESVMSFIDKIYNITGLSFSLPSHDQWDYAASGGNKSLRYTYSGSNTIGDVAWYSGNTSSKQNVKTKAPNELGIYDMSGNIAELTSSITSSGYYYYRGGSYKDASLQMITNVGGLFLGLNSIGYTGSSSYVGFRLILTFP